MDFPYIALILIGLFGRGDLQTYRAKEADDPTVEKDVITKRGTSGDIVFQCTFDIPDVAIKISNGEFIVNWFKTQNATDIQLNNGAILSSNLPNEMSNHLEYGRSVQSSSMLVTTVTIKDARPEESGQYRCETTWPTGVGQSTELTYSLVVTDADEFRVVLNGSDNPHMMPRKPNVTCWQTTNEIQIMQMTHNMDRPQDYAYLGCAAGGPSISAVVTVTLNNPDKPERSRNLHSRMTSVEMVDYVGPEVGAQKKMVWNLLEDRMFPVDGQDDGSTITCVGTVEDKDNKVILRKEVSAVLNLLTKPQFVNCSKEVYAPVGAQNYVISCMIRAKPALTSDVTWSVQPKDSVEFQIQNNNYGYRTDIVGEGTNTFIARLTIEQVSEEEHLRSVFTITAKNQVGESQFRILLLQGTNPASDQTMGAQGQLASLLLLLLSAVAAILVQ